MVVVEEIISKNKNNNSRMLKDKGERRIIIDSIRLADREKILAASIISFAILFLPLFIFIFLALVFYLIIIAIDLFNTWNLYNFLKLIILIICCFILLYVIRYITRWLKE